MLAAFVIAATTSNEPAIAQQTGEIRTLVLSEVATGTLDDGPMFWQFTGNRGAVVSVSIRSLAFDTVVRLLAPTGEELASDDDGGLRRDSHLAAVLPSDGTYWVQVGAFGDTGTGAYKLAVREVVPIPLQLDQLATDTLGVDNPIDVWTLQSGPGQVVSLPEPNVADTFDLAIELRAPTGELLAANRPALMKLLDSADFDQLLSPVESSPGLDSWPGAVLADAGAYQVWVRALNGETGSYHLLVRSVSANILIPEGAAEGATANSLSPDGPPFDVWTVDGIQGQLVTVRADSSDFDTVLEMRTPDGELLGRDDDGGPGLNSRLAAVLATSGRHHIWVRRQDDNLVGGRYTVEARIADAPGPRDAGIWHFDGVAGQLVSVSAGSDAFDTMVELRTPDGTELAENDDGGPDTDSRLLATLPISGRYQIRVAAQDGASGPYHVTVEEVPVMSFDERDPVTGAIKWNPATGAIGGTDGAAVGVWQFNGEAGQMVGAMATSADFDTVLELWTPRDELLARNDDGPYLATTDSRLLAILPETGSYQLRVTPFGDGAGTYRVAVRPMPVAPKPLPLGKAATDKVAANGWFSGNGRATGWFFEFNGAPGQLVSVEASSDAFDTVVHLLAPSGEVIARDDNGGRKSDSHLVAALPARGRYGVRVMPVDGGTGRYELTARIVERVTLEFNHPTSGVLGGPGGPGSF